jgi:uncharacterized membrane-anchored protein YhcB (DUF1043 family)
LIGLIVWVVGVFFGFILRGAFFSASEVELKLTKKLENLESEFSDYQRKLSQQLVATAEVLRNIQDGCESAQEKIAFMTHEIHGKKSSRTGENVETVEPPKDYSSHS